MEHAKYPYEIGDQRIKKYEGLLQGAELYSVDEALSLILEFHGENIYIYYDYHHRFTHTCMKLYHFNVTKTSAQCPHGFITCEDKTCIVETSRCDGIIDCVDGDDEVNCSHICTHPHPVTLCTRCNIADGCRCHSLYYQCSTGGCFSATAICDGLMSCTDGSDELMCTPQLPPMHSCGIDINNICAIFTKHILVISTICIYSRPLQSQLQFQNCEEWECSSMQKCEAAYCVPVHYICDRICDCPKCDDEAICMVDNARDLMLSCPGMVKCKAGYPCVHSYHIQDGEAQCKHTHDDEVQYSQCPENCSCHGTSIYCESFTHLSASDIAKFTAISAANNQLDSLTSLSNILLNCHQKCPSVIYLDASNISDCDTSLFTAMAVNIADVHVLNISYNLMHNLSVSLMTHFHKMIQLYLQHCYIYKIEVGIFSGRSLYILDLSHNKLNIIDDRSFGQMHNLRSIFLQNNNIHTIDLKVFQESSQLINMDLRDNKILSVWLDPTRWTSNALLKQMYSDEHILCCIITAADFCYPPASMFQSCSSLLIKLHNKIILGSVGTAALVLNVAVFGYIVLWKSRERNAKKRQIISCSVHAMTDALYGVHSVGLIIADIIYSEDFGKYREIWKRSLSCTLLESCLSFSIIMPSILIIHMCIVLFISITDISAKISDKHYKLSVLGLIISCVMIISARRLITINLQQLESNNFCIPLNFVTVTSKSLINIAFEWIMVSLNAIVFLSSVVGLTTITCLVNRRQKKIKEARSSRTSSSVKIKLQLYIVVVVLSKLVLHITWFAVLGGLAISPDVLVLLVLCPLSVWPLCHPFIHTFRIKWN